MEMVIDSMAVSDMAMDGGRRGKERGKWWKQEGGRLENDACRRRELEEDKGGGRKCRLID